MIRCLFPLLLAALLADCCVAQTRLPSMWTKQPEIKIARFHALWVFAGFESQPSQENEQLLEGTFERFNGDFLSFGKSQGVNLPAKLKITGSPRVISGKHVTWQDVSRALDQLENSLDSDSRENDVIFVYVLTHGMAAENATNVGDGDKQSETGAGVDLVFNKINEPRKSLADRVDRIPARLKVLITDTCSFDTHVPKVPPPTEHTSGIWRALYFGHAGMVDISSSDREAANLINGKSLFNETFNEAFNIYAVERDAPGSEKVLEKVADVLENLRAGHVQGAIASADEARDEFQTLIDLGPNHGKVEGVVEWDSEFIPYLQRKLSNKLKNNGITNSQTIKIWPDRKFWVNDPSR